MAFAEPFLCGRRKCTTTEMNTAKIVSLKIEEHRPKKIYGHFKIYHTEASWKCWLGQETCDIHRVKSQINCPWFQGKIAPWSFHQPSCVRRRHGIARLIPWNRVPGHEIGGFLKSHRFYEKETISIILWSAIQIVVDSTSRRVSTSHPPGDLPAWRYAHAQLAFIVTTWKPEGCHLQVSAPNLVFLCFRSNRTQILRTDASACSAEIPAISGYHTLWFDVRV